MKATIAGLIVTILKQAEVKQIWGITGDSLNGLNDSIIKAGGIRWLGTRHEEVAAFAAGAEAQLTGKLAVCVGSCGPGNLHLINGLFDCHRNQVPVLAIAAHIPSAEIGRNYFQETHPQQLFQECSHFCELITNPDQVPGVIEIAMRTAILKRGVAVIVIPGDVALQPAPENAVSKWHTPNLPAVIPCNQDIAAAAALLNKAAKITILAGFGCNGAHDEVIALAEILKAPIVHALRGKECLDWDNPYNVGMTGLIGVASGYHAMNNCDTLLVLGTSFPYRAFYPNGSCKIIQIDIDAANLGAHCEPDLTITGNISESINLLLPVLEAKNSETFLQQCLSHYQKTRKELDELARPDDKVAVHPQYLAAEIDRLAAADAVITCDVGTPTVWAARYIRMNGKRKLIGSFHHGSMANALAQALGAKGGAPERQVIALCGDGGFSMLMGDIITMVQEKLPLKIIIINNGSLGFVALEMKAAGYLTNGTDLQNPNFAELAQAAGIKGIRVEKSSEVTPALTAAFADPDEAVIVDVVTAKQELIIPPKIKFEQAKGFSLYMLRAILNGKGNEVIDLAKTNLFR